MSQEKRKSKQVNNSLVHFQTFLPKSVSKEFITLCENEGITRSDGLKQAITLFVNMKKHNWGQINEFADSPILDHEKRVEAQLEMQSKVLTEFERVMIAKMDLIGAAAHLINPGKNKTDSNN